MAVDRARLYDALYAWKDYAAEADYVDRIVRERRSAATTLLDVACGTGKHLERLSGRYRAFGLDRNADYLTAAAGRCPDVAFTEGDMRSFSLGRRFDAVTCLFSAVGYVRTEEGLREAVAGMAAHLEPSGVLLVEPWLSSDQWEVGRLSATFADEPGLKAARIGVAEARDGLAVLDFHFLVATTDGIATFTELHELGLFTDDQYIAAFHRAGVDVVRDPVGPMGRGLYVGVLRA